MQPFDHFSMPCSKPQYGSIFILETTTQVILPGNELERPYDEISSDPTRDDVAAKMM